MSLDAYLASRSDRCACGFNAEFQGCRCSAAAGKAAALAAVASTTPDETRTRIDAAILRAAASGGEFSANDVRADLAGVPGQQIGPRFGALAKRGAIRHVGYLPSTKGNTHGHDVKLWRGATSDRKAA